MQTTKMCGMVKRCLIVGLGQIGMGYDLTLDPSIAVYSHARALSLHPQFVISGGVDLSFASRTLFEQHYHQPSYADTKLALASVAADVVVIASPTAGHREVLDIVLSNAKPEVILCEKPLAYDLSEAREMVDMCESHGVKLFVNYIRRADPGVIEIKKRIDAQAIAPPIKGTVWYSKGFFNNGSHFFNLLEFWLGAFVKAQVISVGRLWNNTDPEPDVVVEFERGKVVFMAAWEEAFSHYTIELISPSGRLRYEQGGKWIAWQVPYADSQFSGHKILEAVPQLIGNDMYRYQWNVADQLANAMSGKPHELCTGLQALATLEAMHQIVNQK